MSTKPGVILQHGPQAPPGLLGEYLAVAAVEHELCRVWQEPVPELTTARFVVSLGSEQSASAPAPAWVPAEIEALRDAALAEVPVLGLCFGAQALAVALGGGVRRAPDPEIGWTEVESEDPDVPAGRWAQYHYDVLEVPSGAWEVARSPAGPAAFRRGPHLGVQFHPEVTRAQMVEWLWTDPDLPHGFDREQAIRDGECHAASAAARAERLFAAWFGRIA